MIDTPAKLGIEIIRASPYSDIISIETPGEPTGSGVPLNLTGWSAKSQIRERPGSRSVLICEFSITYDDMENGKLTRSLTSGTTGGIWHSRGWHDLILISPEGEPFLYWHGDVKIIPMTTGI